MGGTILCGHEIEVMQLQPTLSNHLASSFYYHESQYLLVIVPKSCQKLTQSDIFIGSQNVELRVGHTYTSLNSCLTELVERSKCSKFQLFNSNVSTGLLKCSINQLQKTIKMEGARRNEKNNRNYHYNGHYVPPCSESSKCQATFKFSCAPPCLM